MAQTVFASDATRRRAWIVNDSDYVLVIRLGATATSTAWDIKLNGGEDTGHKLDGVTSSVSAIFVGNGNNGSGGSVLPGNLRYLAAKE